MSTKVVTNAGAVKTPPVPPQGSVAVETITNHVLVVDKSAAETQSSEARPPHNRFGIIGKLTRLRVSRPTFHHKQKWTAHFSSHRPPSPAPPGYAKQKANKILTFFFIRLSNRITAPLLLC